MEVNYNKPKLIDFSAEPLTFNIVSDGTINWTASDASIAKTIDYNLNDSGWTSITSNIEETAPTITVNSGDKLQFRGNNAQYSDGTFNNTFGGSTAEFEVEGNIMSLINPTDFSTLTTIESSFNFAFLFFNFTCNYFSNRLLLYHVPRL